MDEGDVIRVSESKARVEAYVGRLGDRIEDEWRAAMYREGDLPVIAEQALHRDAPPDDLELRDIMRWALASRSLGLQPNAESSFGQPPITLYSGRRFFIEALCWFDSTTAIHSHGFVGAFAVLQGSSVHSTYRFQEAVRYSSRLQLGDVIFQNSEILRRGSVRQILSGDDYIHALYHLDHPSISLVVRTPPLLISQRAYIAPHVAKDPFDLIVWNKRALDFVESALALGDRKTVAETVHMAIQNADDLGAFTIVHSLILKQVSATGAIGAEGRIEAAADNNAGDAARYGLEVAIEAARQKFGSNADLMVASCQEHTRSHELAAARSNVTNPDHRFFLALLMNVPNRSRLLELVKESFPARDPIELVTQWLRELTDASTPLVQYAMGADALVLLECLIRELSVEQSVDFVAKRHARELESAEVEQLREALSVLRTFPLVRPLIRRGREVQF